MVDDDPTILRLVQDALSTARASDAVVTADPKEALALMGEHSPRLALLDLMLPEQRRGGAYGGHSRRLARIPVIFLSAYGRDEVVARVLEKGATDYIVKPFSPTELVARVRAALRRVGEPQRSLLMWSPSSWVTCASTMPARRVTVSGTARRI